jgi:hypothetical protein
MKLSVWLRTYLNRSSRLSGDTQIRLLKHGPFTDNDQLTLLQRPPSLVIQRHTRNKHQALITLMHPESLLLISWVWRKAAMSL